MPTISLSELKSFRKSLNRWREDMNDKADELAEELAGLEAKAGGKSKVKADDKKADDKKDDDEDEEEEEDDDSGPF